MGNGIIRWIRNVMFAYRDAKKYKAKIQAMEYAHEQSVKGMAKARAKVEKLEQILTITQLSYRELSREAESLREEIRNMPNLDDVRAEVVFMLDEGRSKEEIEDYLWTIDKVEE